MSDNSNGITPPTHSFAGLPVCTRLDELAADIAIIGIHYVSPYPPLLTTAPIPTAAETAPDAIRLRASVFGDHWDHYDFDRNELFLADGRNRLVDCGDASPNGLKSYHWFGNSRKIASYMGGHSTIGPSARLMLCYDFLRLRQVILCQRAP